MAFYDRLELTSSSVRGCARCGENHSHVEWIKFVSPVTDDRDTENCVYFPWTHWAPCPNTGDPILCKIGAE